MKDNCDSSRKKRKILHLIGRLVVVVVENMLVVVEFAVFVAVDKHSAAVAENIAVVVVVVVVAGLAVESIVKTEFPVAAVVDEQL